MSLTNDYSQKLKHLSSLIRHNRYEQMTIYRFNLANDVVEAITSFAKVHQYDSKKDYKHFWIIWCEENSEMVRGEVERLSSIGYEGDSLDKMYKSGRYYFRKKQLTLVVEPKKRRLYISMDSAVLDAMDCHIRSYAMADGFTPAKGYDMFCTNHLSLLQNEICRLISNDNNVDRRVIIAKIKKTYKNRYFVFTKPSE